MCRINNIYLAMAINGQLKNNTNNSNMWQQQQQQQQQQAAGDKKVLFKDEIGQPLQVVQWFNKNEPAAAASHCPHTDGINRSS